MEINFRSVIAELDRPGRVLAFCDDTDLTFEATSTMVGNLHLYGGLILMSQAYGPLAHNLAAYLAEIGQVEFHGTEIINPKPTSRWKSLSYAARVEALRHVCMAIRDSGGIFVYARICKAQYANMLNTAGEAIAEDCHKVAVKHVFLRSVAEYLAATPPAIVLIDRDKNTPGPGLVKLEGGATLVGGGAISVNSAHIIGLQMADVVAYAIGRFLKRRDKIAAKYPAVYDSFDTAIMEFLANLDGRLHDITKPLPDLQQAV
ncbi:DUF3800 domain-containing protein [Bradyrhizobium sp. USDA 3315]